MSNYVGIDFGTWMLKAAATESSRAAPQLLLLGDAGSQPFLPAVASATPPLGASWPLFHKRRRAPTVVHGFRDRVIDPSGTLPVGNASVKVTDLFSAVLCGVQESLERTVSDLSAVTVAVPDHWPASPWALPVSLDRAGWHPILCVREWAAVLAALGSVPTGTVILLSAGAGTARAVCCGVRDDHWSVLAKQEEQRVSGAALRGLIGDYFVEEIIRQIRKDPRESPQEDQTFCDAVEQLLGKLQAGDTATWQAELFGQRTTRSLSRGQLADLAAPLREPFRTLLEETIKQASVTAADCRIVLWGELTALLPLGQWLSPALPGGATLELLDADVVARGAARLCALAAEGQFDFSSRVFAGLQKDTGDYTPHYTDSDQGSAFPLLERLPVSFCPSRTGPLAKLVRLDESVGPAEMPVEGTLRIGRDPRSDWTIDDAADIVSRAHALIAHNGAGYFLSDLGTTNGTYLNERLVQGKQHLSDGDVVMLGRNGPEFRFEMT